jgi:hypothetical protein
MLDGDWSSDVCSSDLGNAALKTFDWWNYTGAGHGWEYTSTGANNAARVDWRAKLVAYAVTLK